MRFYVCVCKLSALCDDRTTNICTNRSIARENCTLRFWASHCLDVFYIEKIFKWFSHRKKLQTKFVVIIKYTKLFWIISTSFFLDKRKVLSISNFPKQLKWTKTGSMLKARKQKKWPTPWMIRRRTFWIVEIWNEKTKRKEQSKCFLNNFWH